MSEDSYQYIIQIPIQIRLTDYRYQYTLSISVQHYWTSTPTNVLHANTNAYISYNIMLQTRVLSGGRRWCKFPVLSLQYTKGSPNNNNYSMDFKIIWQLVLQNASERTPNLNNAVLFTSSQVFRSASSSRTR